MNSVPAAGSVIMLGQARSQISSEDHRVGGEAVAEKHVGEKDVVAVKHANIVEDLETTNSSQSILLLN
jgi:hypothetical protein